ncbi:MAG: hypothetical protein AAGA56_10275 [Myxococcota bacterium]
MKNTRSRFAWILVVVCFGACSDDDELPPAPTPVVTPATGEGGAGGDGGAMSTLPCIESGMPCNLSLRECIARCCSGRTMITDISGMSTGTVCQ